MNLSVCVCGGGCRVRKFEFKVPPRHRPYGLKISSKRPEKQAR